MHRELRLLLDLARPHRARYAMGFLALVATDAGNLTVPWLIGRCIDALREGRGTAQLAWSFAGALVGVNLLVAACRYVWRMSLFGSARHIEFALRNRLFAHLLTMGADFYQGRTVGELMTHATSDLQAIRAALGEAVMAAYDALIMLTGTLAVMALTIDARLTALSLLPMPLLALWEWRLGLSVHRRTLGVQQALGVLTARIQETIAGVRVVKAYAQEDGVRRRFQADNASYRSRVEALLRISTLNEPTIALLAGTSTAIALSYGGTLTLQGTITLGQFIAFMSYLGMLTWPMTAMGWAANLVQRARVSMERLQALLDAPPSVTDSPDARAIVPVKGRLAVRHLSFRYAPELPLALDDVSFEVAPGQLFGIIGRTGSGKSTLAQLLVRVFEPPDGAIALDGQDLRAWPVSDVRREIAMVPQDAFLFSETVETNLAYAPRESTAEARAQAIVDAQLADEIAAMPLGLETMLGERGITLSGGQRQRLGIARALLKDAPVLVLDDCLSAVDSDTEARLIEALLPRMKERTTVLITHRVAPLSQADWILVLDEGRIVDQGTHAELIARPGLYRQLAERQQLESALTREAP